SGRGVSANVHPRATVDCTKRRLFMLHPSTRCRAVAMRDSAQVPRQHAVMVQARIEFVSAFTTWPTTNQGWRLMNTAALTINGADHAIQTTAAKRNAPGQPPAKTPPVRATRRKTVAIPMKLRNVTREESM